MADTNDILRAFINVAAKNPELLKSFESEPEKTVTKAAKSNGIDLSNVDIAEVVKVVSPLVSGGKLDLGAVTELAGDLFGGSEKKSGKDDEEGGLTDILGALGNVFGEGTAHESKKNENGGIDLAALGGLASTLFGGK